MFLDKFWMFFYKIIFFVFYSVSKIKRNLEDAFLNMLQRLQELKKENVRLKQDLNNLLNQQKSEPKKSRNSPKNSPT